MPKSIRPLVLVLLVILLAAVGYYLVKSSPLKKSQFANGTIVFTGAKTPGSSTSIFTFSADGKLTELAPSGYSNMLDGSFSTDLKKIAFSATHSDKEVIAVMNIDGTGVQDVSKLDGPKTMPSWSPDGSKILYALATQSGGVSQINVGAGTDIVIPVGTNVLQTPTWMPDGNGFYFVKVTVDSHAGSLTTQLTSFRQGKSTDIAIDGDKGLPITDLGSPSVSPDGSRIAFVRTSDNQVYLVGSDGKGLKTLTKPASSIYSCPSWTSDGQAILVSEATLAGKNYISKIGVNSGTVTRSDVSGFAKIICPREVRY